MSEGRLSIDQMLHGGVHRLSHVNRYSSIPTLRKENVAEHTFYVCLYSYLLAMDYETWMTGRGIEETLRPDYGTLLARAMLHDLDESHTGDFLRTVKYGHPDLKAALDKVSRSMVRKMEDELGVEIMPFWSSAKAPDLEGQIIEIADLCRVASYLYEEHNMGNIYVRPLFSELRAYFQTIYGEIGKLGTFPWDEWRKSVLQSIMTTMFERLEEAPHG